MASIFGMLWLLLSIKCYRCFHCARDVDLEEGNTKVEYSIDKRPKLNDSLYWITEGINVGAGHNYAEKGRGRKGAELEGEFFTYWPSNMEFFLFGKISSATAVMSMGFYDTENNLVYGAVVDCAASTWRTEYKNESYTTNQVWETGKLWKKCEPGTIFDIDYELQQRRRGKFIFNGQPLVDGLYPRYKKNVVKKTYDFQNQFRIKQLPVNLKNGTDVKGMVNGGTLTRYAYGKCYAFPHELRRNCNDTNHWLRARNKLFPTTGIELPSYTVEPGTLSELGLNHLHANVDCWPKFPRFGPFFHFVQTGIHPDQNSNSLRYCCCAYMNGTLVEDTCEPYEKLCQLTCLDYSMYRIKYEGLEEYYLGDVKY